MPKISLSTLCLVTAVLYNTVERSLEHEIPRRSFLSRRAIDGTRGRKYFDPNEDGAFDSYGSAGGEYDPYDYMTDLSDIRKNVPGEPGVDYPAYTTLPQTGFTCEGRSRGYYADEAAGCQVFHVCHDVLVSSFLCPIGSTFSQKLLTCDWWTKVDCSSSNRYLEKNRNSYQIDDDEMIRKAYAMISLQSSTEEVTKDGLVDPDSGARIVDYSALSGRIVMGFLPGGFRRITNYATVDATKNDLPSGFENYPHRDERRIYNYDNQQQKSTNPAFHQGKVHFENKDRSPYHASLIIRHNYQDRVGDNEFQDDYRRSDSRFANRLQTSYAPTVPTVTTTTRRFYSPTVPTTYRPSTLAYNKLDLMVDSSDHLYAHSKTPVTSPTFTHQNEDVRSADLRERETETPKKSENAPGTDRDNKNNDGVHFENDQMHFNLEKKSEANVRINMTGMIDKDVQIFRQQNDRPITKPDSEDSLEDIETKDSIGIARALNNPLGMIMQSQNPVKNERVSLTTSILPQSIPNHFLESSYEKEEDVNLLQTPKKSDIFNETKYDQSTEEDITSLTTKSFEETTYTRSFGDKTTPLLRNWQQNVDVAQASTISATAKPTISTTRKSVDEIHSDIVRSSSNDSYITVDQNTSSTRSISNSNDDSISRLNFSFEIPQPARFLRPPAASFFINVPEETHYTTIDESSKTSWNPGSTNIEIPRFSDTPIAINQDRSPIFNVEEQSLVDYTDDLSQTTNLGIHLTVQPVAEVPTSIPWLVPLHDRAIVDVPVTNIVPPIVDYNDGFGDFVPPNEHAYAIHSDRTENIDSQKMQNFSTTPKNNNSEIETLIQYNTGFQFTIRDAVKAQLDSRANSRFPCYSSTSDEQGKHCETNSAVIAPKVAISTPSVEARTISIGTKANPRIPERLISSSSTSIQGNSATFILDESLTSTTQSPITINSNVDVERSNLKTVIPKSVLEINVSEEKTKKNATESSLSRSIHPESLKQIEETIDKHNSPYEISFTVKRDEDLETTPDDFISRLIGQHQQSASVPKDELDDFEIIRSIEPKDEVADISKFHDTSHASLNNKDNSFPVVIDDTISQFKQSNSNVSMLNLLQLMAELLKLDRLPRPFSAKDLRSAELRNSFNLDLDEQSDATTSPLLIHSQARTSFKNAKPKVSAFDTLKTPVDIAKPKTSLNLNFNEPSLVTTSSLLEPRLPIGKNTDSKISFLEDTLRAPINIPINPLPDVSSRINSNNNATKQKTSQSKAENKTRPLQKQEILEQLTENFGQPLYRDNSIRGPLVFDLPQVQRSLDFETGLPIEESKHVISDAEKISLASSTTGTTTTMMQESTTTMTTESVKTIVETEFVPSLGFSFDTNEGREEYVQAILGGLIDEHTDEGGKKESSSSQLTNRAPKNETLSPEQHENSKDI